MRAPRRTVPIAVMHRRRGRPSGGPRGRPGPPLPPGHGPLSGKARMVLGLAVSCLIACAVAPWMASATAAPAGAAVSRGDSPAGHVDATPAASSNGLTSGSAPALPPAAATSVNSLESAASRASSTGRRVAMSLIALGFALAAIVLAFRRDFREAAGVFAVGLVAVVLATPAGIGVLQDTVTSLFGGH